jgi:hypothetical protein
MHTHTHKHRHKHVDKWYKATRNGGTTEYNSACQNMHVFDVVHACRDMCTHTSAQHGAPQQTIGVHRQQLQTLRENQLYSGVSE